ncbi:MAG: AMP-binding protein [Minicystis sp.]
MVPVGTLPFDAQGRIDERALAALPILDDALIARWEKQIAAAGLRAKVIAAETTEPLASLHISEILPGARPIHRATSAPHTLSAEPVSASSHRPALAAGPPLVLPGGAPRTLTEALVRVADTHPDHGVTVVQDQGPPRFISYPDLLRSARSMLAGLRASGLRPGDRAILQIDDLGRYFAAFWACLLGGIAPVTVSTSTAYDRPTAVLGKLFNVWELLGRPAILAGQHFVAPLAGVRAMYGAKPGDRFRVLAVEDLERHPPADQTHDVKPEDVLFLQLTSGSTGVPKCIQQTHLAVVHHVHASAIVNGYGSDDVTLNWLPMDHVAPILMCHLKDAYLGSHQIHVKPELVLARPLLWLDLMAERRVNVTWSPNFGYKLVNDALAQSPDRRWDLSSIRYLLNGGEQVTQPVAAEFLRRTAPFGLSPTAMEPVFGMAELCTAVTFARGWTPETGIRKVAKSSLSGVLRDAGPEEEFVSFVEVGAPAPGIEIRITGPGNQPLGESMIGPVHVRGRTTTLGYLHNDEANREAFAGDGWFDTGDSRLPPRGPTDHHRPPQGDDHRRRRQLLLLRDRGRRERRRRRRAHLRGRLCGRRSRLGYRRARHLLCPAQTGPRCGAPPRRAGEGHLDVRSFAAPRDSPGARGVPQDDERQDPEKQSKARTGLGRLYGSAEADRSRSGERANHSRLVPPSCVATPRVARVSSACCHRHDARAL